MRIFFYFFFLWVAISGCTAAKNSTIAGRRQAIKISALKFLDEYIIPFDARFQNTWVGGLSGIDYDRQSNRYFMISDERSATSAARFYTAVIDIKGYKMDTIKFLSVHTLRNARNDTFPSLKTMPQHAADPESIRYNAAGKTLVWSSEGDKAIRNGKMVCQNPWIFEMDTTGNFKDSFLIPANLHMYENDSGARENDVLEGLSFTPDFKYLWASMEGAIWEDGPLASPVYANAPVRFTKFHVADKKPVAQYGYLLDAVASEPVPENAFSINGISESLCMGNSRFLVLERSFSTGTASCVIKMYQADFSKATDIADTVSLYQNKNYKPASKKLLFNLSSLHTYIDNVEGVTWGPLLPNGHLSLVLIADNNFSPLEKTQVFLFEVIP